MIIAIDGTSSSGKGTLARRLSQIFNFEHIDTGLFFRAAALVANERLISVDDSSALFEIMANLQYRPFDPSLRTAEAGALAAKFSSNRGLREAYVQRVRQLAKQLSVVGVVIDGRDIGTVIAPDADVKLWVDADVTQRGVRRWKELIGHGETVTLESVIEQLKIRDARDQGRTDAPAAMAADAILIDTTDLTIDAAVEKAVAAVEAALARGKTA